MTNNKNVVGLQGLESAPEVKTVNMFDQFMDDMEAGFEESVAADKVENTSVASDEELDAFFHECMEEVNPTNQPTKENEQMTNTNSVQNVINEIKATRGVTVSVFGQPQEMPATVEKGLVDIIDILESFAGYEVETVLPASYRVDYDEQNNLYDIMDSNDDVIEGGFEYEEEAEERREELEEENTSAASVSNYIEHQEDLGYIEEKSADNSYNWSGSVSNDFNYRIYKSTINDSVYVEFAAHLYGDVRANYTDSVLLKFDNDYTFLELIGECDGYETYKGYGIRFSALSEAYEIDDEECNSMETQYAWEDVIEYIDGLVEEETSEEV